MEAHLMHLPRAHDERMAEAMTLDEDLARALDRAGDGP